MNLANAKIGVLGSGDVGKVLASGFRKHGHDVMIGSRDPAKITDWASLSDVRSGDFAQTAAFGDILVLAVAGLVAEDALRLAGEGNLAGKVVIDATNPIAKEPPDSGVLRYFTAANDSLMEQLQRAFPSARLVKAFNSVGNAFMVNPSFPGGKPTMFICGNDVDAKAAVSQILDVFGWEAADFGDAPTARAIEPLCQLWCAPGMRGGSWTHAFKLLKL